MSDDIGQYQNDIDNLARLNQYSFENIFKVYSDDETGSYYYNIANTIFFPEDISQDVYTTYRVPGRDMSWTNLSYIHYGTIRLWWLLCALNNVDNPMIFPEPGSEIKILKPSSLRDVMQQIQQSK
jgi:hypothetical protein